MRPVTVSRPHLYARCAFIPAHFFFRCAFISAHFFSSAHLFQPTFFPVHIYSSPFFWCAFIPAHFFSGAHLFQPIFFLVRIYSSPLFFWSGTWKCPKKWYLKVAQKVVPKSLPKIRPITVSKPRHYTVHQEIGSLGPKDQLWFSCLYPFW